MPQPSYFHKHRQRIYYLTVLILLLLIPVWIKFIAPHFSKLPDNFSYRANILSIDNFYDESTKKYQGEYISKSDFSYKVTERNKYFYTIETKFSVRTLNDKPIISITRLYFINPYSWQHLTVSGEQIRRGFLFGPRWADESNFYYWHINYNAEALMKFINREVINGLTVNHYEAQYIADQTANLGHLPEVPEKRGIKANIQLQLWIEPISGWLIKYQDNTFTYYYDITTGKKIGPWNKFSNRYTQTTINNQVKFAAVLKWKILIIYWAVPAFLLMFSIFLLCCHQSRKNPLLLLNSCIKLITNYLLILFFIILLFISLYYFFIRQNNDSLYKIGISEWNRSPDNKEAIRGFKDSLAENGYVEGKNIEFTIKNPDANIEKQVDIIQLFQRNKVNIIYTLSTPGTLVAKGMTNKTPVIFSNVTYPEISTLTSPIRKLNKNIVGVKNYIPPAIKLNLFEKIYPNIKVIGFIYHKGDPDSEIQYHEYKKLFGERNIEIIDIPATDLNDLNQKIQHLVRKNYALFLACDALIQEGGGALTAKYGKQHKIPIIGCDQKSIRDGALIGINIDPYLSGMLAGKIASLILQGAEPAWLRIEQPNNTQIMINLLTAKMLGVTIPDDILKNAGFVVGREQNEH